MARKNYAYVNCSMLKWAREETPFRTLEEVELHLRGISAENLSAWENGVDLPSVTEAKKLAQLYKVPLACFYLSAPPLASLYFLYCFTAKQSGLRCSSPLNI